MCVCTRLDDDLSEAAHWVVELSSGLIVYQGQLREAIDTTTWNSLRKFISEQSLSINRMWLKFRDHEEHPLPANARGYFFRQRADAFFGGDRLVRYYLIGHLDDQEIVHVQHWRIPELILHETDQRLASQVNPSLIRNP